MDESVMQAQLEMAWRSGWNDPAMEVYDLPAERMAYHLFDWHRVYPGEATVFPMPGEAIRFIALQGETEVASLSTGDQAWLPRVQLSVQTAADPRSCALLLDQKVSHAAWLVLWEAARHNTMVEGRSIREVEAGLRSRLGDEMVWHRGPEGNQFVAIRRSQQARLVFVVYEEPVMSVVNTPPYCYGWIDCAMAILDPQAVLGGIVLEDPL